MTTLYFFGTINKFNSIQNVNATNLKNLGNVDNTILGCKDIFYGIGKLKDFNSTLQIVKSTSSTTKKNSS